MATLADFLAQDLVTAGLVRRPDVAGAGGRPWLPPCWRFPNGAMGPGDAADQGKTANARDDGLVVSLMWAPGLTPATGSEERRQDGLDLVMRGRAVPAIVTLEAAVRARLIGKTDPGGRSDFVLGAALAGGVYVIQCRMWRPFQPIDTAAGIYTFSVGYVLETRVP